jgi:endonuclease/exonuclease/phosphatase family metal-dependent hydrolase
VKIENAFMRLDYAFHTEDVQISNFNVLKDPIFDKVSDHYPIVFEVNIK